MENSIKIDIDSDICIGNNSVVDEEMQPLLQTLSLSNDQINICATNDDDVWEDIEDSSDEDEDEDDEGSTDNYIDKNKGDFNYGDIINGKYVLIKRLGSGTFSMVWLAYLLDGSKKQKYYAIKVHHQEDYSTGMRESSFLMKMKSLKITSVCLHEIINFIPLNSTVKTPSICFVFDVMTCSVADVIRMLRYEDGLEEDIVLNIIKQIAISLHELQTHNYMYTDVRPENMLIKSNNDQLAEFCELFDEFNYDVKWKSICEKMCIDNNFNLTKKKHKEKFNTMRRELSVALIKDKCDALNDIVDDIPRNVMIDATTKVYLSDFGSVEKYNKNMDDYELQSRNYRAPELLLCQKHNYKIDVWSLGCCACELLTTEYLIAPKSTKHFSIDYNHLFWIIELFGQFPKQMATSSNAEENYFFKSGKFRLDNMQKDWNLKALFEHHETIVSDKMMMLLESMLQVDPKCRASFKDVIDAV